MPTTLAPDSAAGAITPEMIKAGQSCLDHLLDRSVGPTEGLWVIPEDWAEAVYRAMHACRPLPSPQES